MLQAVFGWFYRPITCRSAPVSSHTAFRRDIAMSQEISASDFSAQETRNLTMKNAVTARVVSPVEDVPQAQVTFI